MNLVRGGQRPILENSLRNPGGMLSVYFSWPGRVGDDEFPLGRRENSGRRRRW